MEDQNKISIAKPSDLPNISLEVLPLDVTDKRHEFGGTSNAVVRISVPEEPEEKMLKRQPVDISAVIDISGSMGSRATYEVDGQERSDGLRILDIAVHAVKVIVSSLQEEDRFSLVTFDGQANLVYPLNQMTLRNRNEAVKVAGQLQPRGCTNIWGGIEKGLDSLRTNSPTRPKVVLLLTDGQPTTTPYGGHVKAFSNYCRTYKFRCQLSCFGFGYKLDSKLLLEMSEVGNGTFAFIPMAPVLGTVFTHALASVLSTFATNSKLVLHAPRNGGGYFVRRDGLVGGLDVVMRNKNKMEINVGPLLFGHTRDILVPMRFSGKEEEGKTFLKATLVGRDLEMKAKGKRIEYCPHAEVGKLRSWVSDTLLRVVKLGELKKLHEAKQELNDLMKLMENSNEAYDERVEGLKKDVTGRCMKALDGMPRFNRWGKHYLRALLRAQAVQQCTNKLDQSVQVYGGSLFATMRQKGDDIFLKMPIVSTRPTPSYSRTTPSKTTYTPPRRVVNNTNYTGGGGGGGCFGGESTVIVFPGENEKSVKEVKKGDVVKVSGTANGKAKVVCVVEYVRTDPKPLVAIPNGPFITKKHPIKVNGVWRMPEGLGKMVTAGESGKVYNFVLEPRNAVMLVDGFECVALGHGLKGNGVEHAFYGTERSVDEVRKLSGWKEGKVVIGGIVRDGKGHAKGFL